MNGYLLAAGFGAVLLMALAALAAAGVLKFGVLFVHGILALFPCLLVVCPFYLVFVIYGTAVTSADKPAFMPDAGTLLGWGLLLLELFALSVWVIIQSGIRPGPRGGTKHPSQQKNTARAIKRLLSYSVGAGIWFLITGIPFALSILATSLLMFFASMIRPFMLPIAAVVASPAAVILYAGLGLFAILAIAVPYAFAVNACIRTHRALGKSKKETAGFAALLLIPLVNLFFIGQLSALAESIPDSALAPDVAAAPPADLRGGIYA